MHNDTPEEIRDILEGLKATSELGRNLQEARIWENWASIVPKPYRDKSYPLRVKDSILVIEVETAVFLHKISYLKQEILENIRQIISVEIVADVRFTLEEEDKSESR
ncbi:MAG: DUF721 domain-containing protein [Candidatus Hydrogenedentota bacterium]